jgi:hypothetical protein
LGFVFTILADLLDILGGDAPGETLSLLLVPIEFLLGNSIVEAQLTLLPLISVVTRLDHIDFGLRLRVGLLILLLFNGSFFPLHIRLWILLFFFLPTIV